MSSNVRTGVDLVGSGGATDPYVAHRILRFTVAWPALRHLEEGVTP